MLLQIRSSRKLFLTDFAFVWFFSSVDSLMTLEVRDLLIVRVREAKKVVRSLPEWSLDRRCCICKVCRQSEFSHAFALRSTGWIASGSLRNDCDEKLEKCLSYWWLPLIRLLSFVDSHMLNERFSCFERFTAIRKLAGVVIHGRWVLRDVFCVLI